MINFDSLTPGSILTSQLQSQDIIVNQKNGDSCTALILNVSKAESGVYDFGGSLLNAICYGGGIGRQLNIDFVLPNGTLGITEDVSLRV